MWRLLAIFLLASCSSNYFGDKYVGTRYLLDPLGEETAPDTDPLIRFDAFDCMTFVETVLANNDVNQLNKIRYANGIPNFVERNHFIETDWIANNSDIVENISNRFAQTAKYTVTIDRKTWFKKMHGIDTNFAPQTVTLEYIPYKFADNIKVPEPVVVLFLRSNPKIRNKLGTDIAVRHIGFLLPDGRLRHASRREKRVVDVNFDEYIDQMVENKNNLGIIVLRIKK